VKRLLMAVMVLLATASLSAQWRPDTTLPTVTLTAPAQGAVVSGTVTLSSTARDNVRVAGVQFLLDGANLGAEDTLAPYARTWNTATAANGAHTLGARARDGSGNRATATITVTVNNVAPPPPTCTLSSTATAPTTATAGAAVSFTATATASNCTGTVSYGWAFGDSGTATTRTATHAYASTGVYGWTLSVSVENVTVTKTGTITVLVAAVDLFYDDFAVLDTTSWGVADNAGDASNNELQYYLPANVTVGGAGLQILTQVESAGGYAYTSGMVYWRSLNFTYGTVEVRAKMAGGQGPWPALWLLGYLCQSDSGCNWPQPGSDEIDMTEILGSNHTRVNQQIHSGGNNRGCSAFVTDVSQNWHTYQLVWKPGSLVWKIDGVTTCSLTSGIPSTPMFLIINTAVGGAGGSVNPATLPQTMQVDYVRVTK
jgi:beta-glucanase (GH16 family)